MKKLIRRHLLGGFIKNLVKLPSDLYHGRVNPITDTNNYQNAEEQDFYTSADGNLRSLAVVDENGNMYELTDPLVVGGTVPLPTGVKAPIGYYKVFGPHGGIRNLSEMPFVYAMLKWMPKVSSKQGMARTVGLLKGALKDYRVTGTLPDEAGMRKLFVVRGNPNPGAKSSVSVTKRAKGEKRAFHEAAKTDASYVSDDYRHMGFGAGAKKDLKTIKERLMPTYTPMAYKLYKKLVDDLDFYTRKTNISMAAKTRLQIDEFMHNWINTYGNKFRDYLYYVID